MDTFKLAEALMVMAYREHEMSEPEPSPAKATEQLTGDALTIAFLKANLADLRTGGMITVAMTNPNVMSYMEHWEGRAEKAEKLAEELLSCLVALADDARNSCNAAQHPALANALFDADQVIFKARQ